MYAAKMWTGFNFLRLGSDGRLPFFFFLSVVLNVLSLAKVCVVPVVDE